MARRPKTHFATANHAAALCSRAGLDLDRLIAARDPLAMRNALKAAGASIPEMSPIVAQNAAKWVSDWADPATAKLKAGSPFDRVAFFNLFVAACGLDSRTFGTAKDDAALATALRAFPAAPKAIEHLKVKLSPASPASSPAASTATPRTPALSILAKLSTSPALQSPISPILPSRTGTAADLLASIDSGFSTTRVDINTGAACLAAIVRARTGLDESESAAAKWPSGFRGYLRTLDANLARAHTDKTPFAGLRAITQLHATRVQLFGFPAQAPRSSTSQAAPADAAILAKYNTLTGPEALAFYQANDAAIKAARAGTRRDTGAFSNLTGGDRTAAAFARQFPTQKP